MSDRISVLHVCDHLGWAGSRMHGVKRLFAWTLPRFDRSRFDVSLVSLRKKDTSEDTLEQFGIDVTYLHKGKFDPATLTALLKVMDRKGTQVLHLHGYGATTFGRIAAAMRGTAVLLHEHANHTTTPWFQQAADTALAPWTDLAIAVSKSTADFTTRARKIPEARTRVVYLGAPLEEFGRPRSGQEIAAARAALGIPPGTFAVGTVTRLMPAKGNRYLVEAVKPIVEQIPEAHVYIAGEGELQAELEAQARTLGIADRVHFLGFQRDVASVLAAYDLVVFPSLWEGTPLTSFEALAMGKPIVSTDADGLCEILHDGVDAVIVPRESGRAIADAVVALERDPARRAALGAEAQRTSQRYDIGTWVRKMERLYELMARVSKPTRRQGLLHEDLSFLDSGREAVNIPRAAQLGRLWSDPGAVATVIVGALLLGFALSVKFPVVAFGFQSDEATYYSLGHSLARDWDMQFQRQDLIRVYQEFPTGPEGIFLKRGRSVHIEPQSRPPFVRWVKGPDPRTDRLYYGKSFVYPLFASPFIALVGTNGFLVLHALLLTACFGAMYAFVRARSSAAAALSYTVVFLFASAAPVYFVWLTPELFNLSLVMLGLFFWAYKEVAPALVPTGTWLDRWGRLLRSPWSDVVACTLLGIATFSKPLNVFAAAPVLWLALLRRQWGRVAVVSLTFVAATGGLFLVNGLSSGDLNYQGGGADRSTFYGRFPFQTAEATFENTGQVRATDGLLTEVIFNRDVLTTVLVHNLGYFLVGRHTGLVPYFFPGILTLVLFLLAHRQRREPFQWLVLLTLLLASVSILIYMPFTYSGGGGPVGNRYFLGYYALFVLLVPAAITVRVAVLAAVVGGIFTAQLIANPFYTSYRPETHAKYGLFRFLPIELSLVNDMPVNVTAHRAKQPLAGDPPVQAYFLDDNAYNREGEWFWVRGESRADLILRAPARPHDDGAYTSLALTALKIQVATGAAAAVVSIDTGAERVRVAPGANSGEEVRVAMPEGFPYKAVPGQPLNRVYTISIAASEGFVPLFAEGVRDTRFLGARIRITPLYRDDRYQPPPRQ